MRPAAAFAALFLGLSLITAAHASVAVHGMLQDPLGAATLSVVDDATTGLKKLVVANIGSSGQDGVSIALPRSNGLSLSYGDVPADGLPHAAIIHRDLACRVLSPGLPTPLTLATLIEDAGSSGTGVDLSVVLPGAPDMQIELFNGTSLVYLSKKGYDYWQAQSHMLHIDGAGVALGEPGVSVSMRFGRPAINTALQRACTITMERPSVCDITVDGVTYSADRIKVQFPTLPSSPELRCVDALLHATSDGSGGGGGGGSGEMAIATKGAPATKETPKSKRTGLTISSVAGGMLADGGGTGDLQRIRVIPDTGPVAQACVISLWGLPPGTPVLYKTAEDLAVRIVQSGFQMPPGQSLTFKGHPVTAIAGITGGAVAGIVVAAVIAQCTADSPSGYAWTAHSDDPAKSVHYELYRGPRQTVSLDGTYSPKSSQKPRSNSLDCPSGQSQMGFGFPPGTSFVAGGAVYDADSMVVVFGPNSDPVIGFDSEDLLPSQDTQFTLLSTEYSPYGSSEARPPRAVFTWGTGLITSVDARRHEIRGLGSSGQDGVSVSLHGLPSAQIPFPDGLDAPVDLGFEFDADPCDDGSCAPISVLKPKHLSNIKWSTFVSFPDHGTNPLFEEANGRVSNMLDCDADGDGIPEVYALPGSSLKFASVSYEQQSPYRACWRMRFTTPVRIVRSGMPETIEAGAPLTIWRNISGLPVGAPSAPPQVVSLNGLPPGVPYIGELLAIEPVKVTLSGTGSDASLAHNSIAGLPVKPAWTEVSGPVEIGDLNGDGRCDLTRTYATDPNGNPDPTPIELGVRENDVVTFEPADGYVFSAPLDSIPLGPDGMLVEMECGGTQDGAARSKSATIAVMASPGGSMSVACDFPPIGPPAQCDAYLNGVLQSSFAYTGPITCDRAPNVMDVVSPPSSGGQQQAECRFRSPVFVNTGGPTLVQCDALRWGMPSPGHTTLLSSCVVRLNGLPPGEPVFGTLLARIVPAGEILAVPEPGPHVNAAQFALSQAWPNPMHAASAVRFAVPQRQHVRALVMDVAGREVARLADQDYEAGEHTLRWSGMDAGGAPVAAGLYFVRVEAAGRVLTTRVTRLR